MKRYLEQLNSQERRVVVAVGLVVFMVLNFWFVWPHFYDWSRDNARMAVARKTLATYRAEMARKPEYERRIRSLESAGMEVPLEDQAINFERYYHKRANDSGVIIQSNSRLMTRTNEFFLEQEMGVTLQAAEKQLVEFLYSLGTSNSLVRVRAMSLRPDSTHQQLNANITIVASYQKKAPVRQTGPASPTPPAKTKEAAANPATPGPKPGPHTNRPAALVSKPGAITNKVGHLTAKKP